MDGRKLVVVVVPSRGILGTTGGLNIDMAAESEVVGLVEVVDMVGVVGSVALVGPVES